MSATDSATDVTAPAGGGTGQLLFRFVRHWSRRSAATGAAHDQGRLVVVVEAVHALRERGAPASVNAVAHELGVDQSGASRLVRDGVRAGHLAVHADGADSRRREVTVTPAGVALLARAHLWQERTFEQLTAGWSQQRRRDFHRAMADLLQQPAGGR